MFGSITPIESTKYVYVFVYVFSVPLPSAVNRNISTRVGWLIFLVIVYTASTDSSPDASPDRSRPCRCRSHRRRRRRDDGAHPRSHRRRRCPGHRSRPSSPGHPGPATSLAWPCRWRRPSSTVTLRLPFWPHTDWPPPVPCRCSSCSECACCRTSWTLARPAHDRTHARTYARTETKHRNEHHHHTHTHAHNLRTPICKIGRNWGVSLWVYVSFSMYICVSL